MLNFTAPATGGGGDGAPAAEEAPLNGLPKGPAAALVGFVVLAAGVGTQAGVPGDQAGPRRIVSLAPSITETLYALGAGGMLVGVSDFCRYPPEAASLPAVGGLYNPNLEVIVSLHPDLVLMFAGQDDLAARLAALHLKTRGLPFDSMEEIMGSILEIGRLTGRGVQAGELAARMRHRVDAVARRTASCPRVSVLLILARSPGTLQGLYALGPGSYLDDLVEKASGTNVLSDASAPYPKISVEQVLARDPEVIIDTSLTGTEDEGRRAKARTEWEQLASLRAVRNQKIFVVTDRAFTIPGPRLATVVERLATMLHGEALREGSQCGVPEKR